MQVRSLNRRAAIVMVLHILGQELCAAESARKSVNDVVQTMKLDVDLVSLNVVVTDQNGRPITALEKKDFKVYEDRIEQPISFFSHDDMPVSWGLVLDHSRSMQQVVEDVHQAAVHLLEEGTGQDEMFILTFNHERQLVRDFTSDRHELANSIFGLTASGKTAMFDAVALALDRLQGGIHPKKALIVVTDGEDNSSELNFNELIEFVEERDVLIYAMGMFEPPDPRRPGLRGRQTRWQLEKLANVTGGKAYFPSNTRQCHEAVRQIALEVSHQYNLSYYSTRQAGGRGWRKLKVVVQPAEDGRKLVARSRSRYFVPER